MARMIQDNRTNIGDFLPELGVTRNQMRTPEVLNNAGIERGQRQEYGFDFERTPNAVQTQSTVSGMGISKDTSHREGTKADSEYAQRNSLSDEEKRTIDILDGNDLELEDFDGR